MVEKQQADDSGTETTSKNQLGVPPQLRPFHSEFECDGKNKDAISAKRYAAIMKSSQLLIPPKN